MGMSQMEVRLREKIPDSTAICQTLPGLAAATFSATRWCRKKTGEFGLAGQVHTEVKMESQRDKVQALPPRSPAARCVRSGGVR